MTRSRSESSRQSDFLSVKTGTKILALGASKLRAIEQHRHIPTIGLGAAIEISSRRIIEGKELVIWGGLGIIEMHGMRQQKLSVHVLNLQIISLQ
jgi:hypothetical protein